MPRGATGQREVTRARLLEASFDAFAEKGYHQSSIEHICERAGYTRGAFYSNFLTKEELFFELYDIHYSTVLAKSRDALEKIRAGGDPTAEITTLFGQRDERERKWFIIQMEFGLYAIHRPELMQVLATHEMKMREEAGALVDEFMQVMGRELTVDMDTLIRATIIVRDGSALRSCVEPQEMSESKGEEMLVAMLLSSYSRPIGEE